MRSQLHLDLHSNSQNRENHHGNRRKENKEAQNNSEAERIQGSRNGIPGRTILDGANAKRIKPQPSPAAKPGRGEEGNKMTIAEEKAMAKTENIANWLTDIQEETEKLHYDTEGITWEDLDTLEEIQSELADVFKKLEDINKGL